VIVTKPVSIVSRYAPAPTGFLHLGHVVNAIYVWGLTRAAGGRVLLRIEDHDRQRSRSEYEGAILDDLEWLGFVPDEPPIASFRAGSSTGRQSDRAAVYARALSVLRDRGLVYACGCSRSAIAQALAATDGSEVRYPGTCADRALPDEGGRGLRVRLAATTERFDDLIHGWQRQRPADQCGDLLIRDREGNWTYQFAAAVDDFAQGVTLIVRGDDLRASTGRQIQLARLLGRIDPPRFLHHALVMKSAAQKLSKADRDSGIRELRASGWSAEAVIGHAAAAAGLIEVGRDVAAADVKNLAPFARLAHALTSTHGHT
jgi:glutamyl-tRNA synthetase/glutamyl-Q tRNA(Asp) synthetase